MENMVILGSGIAGLTAAIYAARANLAPLVVSGHDAGGQLMLTTDVENFPCFPEGIKGPEMISRSKEQAQKFGAKFQTAQAKEVKKVEGGFEITTEEGAIQTKSLVIATGASARWLNLPTEKQFQGKGVHTCATCDGFFYKEKEIIVVGGGDSAMEESNFLTKFAKKVYLVHRKDSFRASKIMADRAMKNPKIEIVWNTEITEYMGEKNLEKVKLKDTKTGEEREMPINGVFLAIGHIPNTKFLGDMADVDEHGFLKADKKMVTSVPGLFAAGDVQDPIFKQAISAAGSGCMAAMSAERYVEAMEAEQNNG